MGMGGGDREGEEVRRAPSSSHTPSRRRLSPPHSPFPHTHTPLFVLQLDPEVQEGLPQTNPEEYRPFERKLGEFPAWVNAARAVLVAFFMTFFSLFDVPVFWPILLVYFIALFGLTMRNQIAQMIKYR